MAAMRLKKVKKGRTFYELERMKPRTDMLAIRPASLHVIYGKIIYSVSRVEHVHQHTCIYRHQRYILRLYNVNLSKLLQKF